MKPQLPSAPKNPTTFVRLMQAAFVELGTVQQTYLHAFDVGIRARELVRYASGAMNEAERREFTGLLGRSPWAVARVVALVKRKRDGGEIPTLTAVSDLDRLKSLDLI